MRRRKRYINDLLILGAAAIFLCGNPNFGYGQVVAPMSQPESQSCADHLVAYIKQLDALFEADRKERRHSIVPYIDLNKAYFPYSGCEPEAVSRAASESRFFQKTFGYGYHFSNGYIEVGFNYLEHRERLTTAYARYTDK